MNNQTYLITGGTGSFGQACVRALLDHHDPHAVRVFSRDEHRQMDMAAQYADDDRLRFLLGDVRDLDRLRLAMRGVDVVIHAAALKQVTLGEFNPFEVVMTNVIGTQNVATAAIDVGVPLVIGISSDKASAPSNLYGATKMVGERIFAQAGVYAAGTTRFASARYGNLLESRGSVIPLWREQAKTGVVTITDLRMTRFLLTTEQAAGFVLSCLPVVRDGEVFVAKLQGTRIIDLAETIAPGCEHVIVGIRPGEKLHETLLTEDEARDARDLGDRYVILPHRVPASPERGKRLPEGFVYSSERCGIDRVSEPSRS